MKAIQVYTIFCLFLSFWKMIFSKLVIIKRNNILKSYLDKVLDISITDTRKKVLENIFVKYLLVNNQF